MRDMRPDNEDPGFQQVPFEDQEPPPPPSGRRRGYLAALALFMAPLVTILAVFALWPNDDSFAPPGPAAEVQAPAEAFDPVASLAAAQGRVASLEEEIAARDTELAALKGEQGVERSEVEAQLATLRANLSKARAQRDDLRGRLTTALADLDREVGVNVETRKQVVALKAANTQNVWVAFTQSAKIDICGQITERGREKCREKLDAYFDDSRQARFAACIDDHHTVPSLWKRPPTGAMPDYADALDLGPGKKNDYYVQFCNPTLPEAVLAEEPPVAPAVFVAGR